MPKFLIERIHKGLAGTAGGGREKPTLPGEKPQPGLEPAAADVYRAVEVKAADLADTKTLALLATVDNKLAAAKAADKGGVSDGR